MAEVNTLPAFYCYALTGNRTPVSTLKEWRPNR